jgi:MoxR-like ATPase
MQERRVTVDGVSHELPDSFTVFATQNPIEFEGTYPLPEAELDRFVVKVLVGYPEERVEQGILGRVLGGFEADVPASYGVARVAEASELAAMREATRRVRVEARLVAYITAIVRATRTSPVLTLGASPRGSVALLKMAQAAALLDARPYVVPDDVKELAPAVLRHRVAVAPELELEGITPDAALRGIIEKVEAP